MTTNLTRDYYCSMKFKYLKIDLSSQTTYNCHAAVGHKIDFDHLKQNPGSLFNTEINVNERIMMLHNERNSSCEQNCWRAEDIGSISPRLYQNGITKTHVDPLTTPEIVDITVGTDCNLTCAYCCKEFSSAWRRDLLTHGNYTIFSDTTDRYVINDKDKILDGISQRELQQLARYQLLIKEIQSYSKTLKKIDITGGEPLLDNQLLSMLDTLDISPQCHINLYTGLGVDYKRFEKIINRLSKIQNLKIIVSAENIGALAEFNRYGIKWTEFQKKIKLLSQLIKWEFHCTLTNMTLLGFVDFYQLYPHIPKAITFAYQPTFMSVNVLDDRTKQYIQDQLRSLPAEDSQKILQSLDTSATDSERQALAEFLVRFIKHKNNIDLSIFPKTFIDWLQIKNVV